MEQSHSLVTPVLVLKMSAMKLMGRDIAIVGENTEELVWA